MRRIRYTSIQRFCLHDGPGIRTTVFLKGCNLHCPWCCNPENIDPGNDWPTFEAEPVELVAELLKDRAFFGEEGGVTWSGGEPLLQSEAIAPAMRMLREQGIHQTVETALFISQAMLERVLGLVDLFIVDAKIMNHAQCARVLGGDLDIYLRNIKLLNIAGAKIRIRIPLVSPHITDSRNIENIIELISQLPLGTVELLRGHNLGKRKWKMLQAQYLDVPELDESATLAILESFRGAGIPVLRRG